MINQSTIKVGQWRLSGRPAIGHSMQWAHIRTSFLQMRRADEIEEHILIRKRRLSCLCLLHQNLSYYMVTGPVIARDLAPPIPGNATSPRFWCMTTSSASDVFLTEPIKYVQGKPWVSHFMEMLQLQLPHIRCPSPVNSCLHGT
jgi:hypothetical protein